MRRLIEPYSYGGATFLVGLADQEEEKDACYRLRYNSYCLGLHPDDNPRFDPDDYPDGREIGSEDDYSHMLIAMREVNGQAEAVGTFRFTPCDQHFFTMGKPFGPGTFDLPSQHNGTLVTPATTFEAGRWIGHPALTPEGDRVVLVHMLLAQAGMVLSEEMGYRHWMCVIDHAAAVHGRKSDWPIDPLIEGVHMYLGVPSEACIIPLRNGVNRYHCPRLGQSADVWRARLERKGQSSK